MIFLKETAYGWIVTRWRGFVMIFFRNKGHRIKRCPVVYKILRFAPRLIQDIGKVTSFLKSPFPVRVMSILFSEILKV